MSTITLRFPGGDKVVEAKRQIAIHGFPCALHRHYADYDSAEPFSDYPWAVSEVSTGTRISIGDSMKDALADAYRVAATRSKTEFRQAITKVRAKITRRDKKLANEKV